MYVASSIRVLFPSGSSGNNDFNRYLVVYIVVLLLCFAGIRAENNKTKPRPAPRRDAEYPPPDFLETLRPIRERCANESGVGADAIRQFSDGESHDADSQLKCYMACMFEVSDVLGPDGDVHLETLYNRLPQSMKAAALKMGVPCLKIQGEGRCERAYYLHSCWKRSDPEHYFIV